MSYKGAERRNGEEGRKDDAIKVLYGNECKDFSCHLKDKLHYHKAIEKRRQYDRRGQKTAEELAEFMDTWQPSNRVPDKETNETYIKNIKVERAKSILSFLNTPKDQK